MDGTGVPREARAQNGHWQGQQRSLGGPLQAVYQKPSAGLLALEDTRWAGLSLSTQACGAQCPGACCDSAPEPPGVGLRSSDLRGRPRPEVGTSGVSRQCHHAPGSSKTGVPEPPMPDLGGPLGSDSGKLFSESYLGDLPGNWAPARSTSPLRTEFQGVACCAGLVAVRTAKRYRIPKVGGAGDRPVPAPPHPGWAARLLGGHSGRSCSKSESRLLHPVVRR